MQLRMNHRAVNPAGFQALLKLEDATKKMGLDPVLYELIKIRASQINGCSFCLDMHTTDLRNIGETEQRVNLILVWRETPLFTEKERAALALTEAVTRISEAGVPQEVYDEVRKHFSESEYVSLIMAINAINCWNRIAIATGMYPGCF
ncbi:carboxymuconolactone decarboxylase family protein [Paenibacillus montanisoli]|uniref:Carboxymuconolactone decarboxylase family protein n=1 Tax=Paenibacillus montanisoli TaxID=2081970 RepID=A0A328TUI2_9BACL|nr:carboxymuconolactone decarboxylase family protein [Paenibacillus montanisoli]RAP74198.1 carboxymuconolactone decarboxylase family protein [Paenibacillus montanisoli]